MIMNDGTKAISDEEYYALPEKERKKFARYAQTPSNVRKPYLNLEKLSKENIDHLQGMKKKQRRRLLKNLGIKKDCKGNLIQIPGCGEK